MRTPLNIAMASVLVMALLLSGAVRADSNSFNRQEQLRDAAEAQRKLKEDAVAKESGLGLDRSARKRIQQGLVAEGFDPGPADGLFGPRTRAAIRGWQEVGRKAATGYLDEASAKALAAAAGEETEAVARGAGAGGAAVVKESDAGSREVAEKSDVAERREDVPEVGRTFRDCPECPEMVVVPEGSYQMGSSSGDGNEKPVHRVTIARPFAVGVYEVTFDEWDACVSGGGCGGHRPDDEGWGRGSRPVINVSWNDAQGYVEWILQKTGEEYRLLSESEWEYVARARTTGAYHVGSSLSPSQANYSESRNGKTVSVGSYSANGFGLYDVHGNVWEWVEDCWHDSYRGAPSDGSAWTSGGCSYRVVLRGGSWVDAPRHLRSAYRSWDTSGSRFNYVGFRIARTLTP